MTYRRGQAKKIGPVLSSDPACWWTAFAFGQMLSSIAFHLMSMPAIEAMIEWCNKAYTTQKSYHATGYYLSRQRNLLMWHTIWKSTDLSRSLQTEVEKEGKGHTFNSCLCHIHSWLVILTLMYQQIMQVLPLQILILWWSRGWTWRHQHGHW